MRVLVYAPNGTAGLKKEIVSRLESGAARGFDIEAVDAENPGTYAVEDWNDFRFVLKHHKSEFGCAVIAADGIAIDFGRSDIRKQIAIATREVPDIPIVVYVSDLGPSTIRRLIEAGATHVVNRDDDDSTLAAHIKHKIAGIGLEQTAELGPIRLDMMSGEASYGEQTVRFEPAELEILQLYHRKRGRLLTKEHIANELHVRDPDEPRGTKIVDVYVCRIRKKLNQLLPGAGEASIQTAWGRGTYMPKKIDVTEGAHKKKAKTPKRPRNGVSPPNAGETASSASFQGPKAG